MKKLTEYQAIITDLDGTLYFQRPVRIAMLKEMVLHFWKLRELLIVWKYRNLFELGFDEKDRLDRLPRNASTIIQEWMVERPCPYVTKNRDEELIRVLAKARDAGITIIVYSDYPVEEKLSAMCFAPDMAYCSNDIGTSKPDASGLKRILSVNNIISEQCLVIGDRKEKDGILAQNLGADALIMPKTADEREKIYRSMEL